MTRRTLAVLLVALVVMSMTTTASAFPGVFVTKNNEKRILHSTHYVLMQKGDTSVVTVAPDYEGPFTPFAIVMVVPGDVTPEHIKTMRRENLTRIESITAPRFHDFYEKDPCEPGEPQQEWQRDLSVKTTGFLGGNQEIGGKKAAREFSIDLNTKYKDSESEYRYHLIGGDATAASEDNPQFGEGYPNLDAFLDATGFKMSADAKKAFAKYQKQGMKLLAIEVDTKMIEIGAKERAQLAGIRYWTKEKATTIQSTLGLANLDGKQDLFVYVLHPEQRFAPKNYGYTYPPTNIELKASIKVNGKNRVVKERIGEIYNALHDRIAAKHPNEFLYEFAWHTQGCGEPCPNEKLLVNELLMFGGEVFEEQLPDEERNPEPPEETEEEKKAFEEELKAKELKPAEKIKAKKAHEEERKDLARRKGIIARQNFVLSRFHYRYDGSNLKKDVEIGAVGDHIRGGVGLPKGLEPKIEMGESKIKKKGETSKYQVRFNHYWEWDGQVKCEAPKRGRWGKRWRHKRVWNKIWVAVDLTNRRRNELDPSDVIETALPDLGISPKQEPTTVADAGVSVVEEKKGGCGCRAPGQTRDAGSTMAGWVMLGLLGLAAAGRRRR
jgi:MYXO-CTERM domain-containing protein